MSCGCSSLGCGGMATRPAAPAPYIGPVAPSMSATSAAPVVVPMTPCKCGRFPWWWIVVALAVGYAMNRRKS